MNEASLYPGAPDYAEFRAMPTDMLAAEDGMMSAQASYQGLDFSAGDMPGLMAGQPMPVMGHGLAGYGDDPAAVFDERGQVRIHPNAVKSLLRPPRFPRLRSLPTVATTPHPPGGVGGWGGRQDTSAPR
jgi:hypothetical protein